MNIPIDLHWLEAFMLASVRMAAFIVIAPPFSYKAFPGQVKAMLALGLGLAVTPLVVPTYPNLDTIGFLGALATELLTGFALGFLVMVVFSAIQSVGSLVDLFGGFQVAQAFDPQMNLNGAQFTRLYQMASLALVMSSGAYQLIIGGLGRTFTAIPIGHGIDIAATAHRMVEAVTGMFLAAVQIAGPLIIVLFLADLGLGLLTRIAPALNAFSLGYPLKILLTLSLGGVLFIGLPAIIESLTGQAVKLMAGA